MGEVVLEPLKEGIGNVNIFRIMIKLAGLQGRQQSTVTCFFWINTGVHKYM